MTGAHFTSPASTSNISGGGLDSASEAQGEEEDSGKGHQRSCAVLGVEKDRIVSASRPFAVWWSDTGSGLGVKERGGDGERGRGREKGDRTVLRGDEGEGSAGRVMDSTAQRRTSPPPHAAMLFCPRSATVPWVLPLTYHLTSLPSSHHRPLYDLPLPTDPHLPFHHARPTQRLRSTHQHLHQRALPSPTMPYLP